MDKNHTTPSFTRRSFLRLLTGGVTAVALPSIFGCKTRLKVKRPNVIILFDDQLRADVCGVYGGKAITTPNIDHLANHGITFSNAVSSCPLCTPYRGSLMTGRYPSHSGIVLNFIEANPIHNPNCLANLFSKAGYNTGFIGKWHLSGGVVKHVGKFTPSREAFLASRKRFPESEFVPPGPRRLGFDYWAAYNFHVAFNNYWYYHDEPKKIYSEKYETDTEIDQAIDYIQKYKDSEKPFFLTVAPHPPHPPFSPDYIPEGYLDLVPEKLEWSPNVPVDNPRDLQEYRYYLAMAKNVDDNLGRLMQFLNMSGIADNTIVVFTSDHGEMHGSHGRINKMVPYAEAMNIPLIIRWPAKIKAGQKSDALYTPMDHLPTLCSLVGINIPGEIDGIDLSNVLLGRGSSNRDEILIANYTSNWDFFQSGTQWPEWRGVKTKRYTYCKWLSGEEELYDNLKDPYQMKNLVLGQKDSLTLNRLRRCLKDLLAEAHDEFLPGTAYADWYDDERNLIRTGLGQVKNI